MSADYTLTNPLYPSKVHAMLGGDERELLSDQGVQDGEIPLTCSELWTDAVSLKIIYNLTRSSQTPTRCR